MPELGEQKLHPSAQLIALGRGDLGGQAPPLAQRPPRPGEQAIEMVQQALQRVRGLLLLQLALDLQVQPRILDQALANLRRRVAPGGIQRGDLAALELLLGDRLREAFTRLAVDARQRHQRPHRRLRRDLSAPDPLLDRRREILHQSQVARDPTGAPVETSRELLLAPTRAARQLRQQPPLLQGRVAGGVAQAALQDQRLGLAQVPQRRLDRVVVQALQRPKPLVAIDDHVALRGLAVAHDDDRLLLSVGLQRQQQPTLTLRAEHPQRLVASLQLVKLKLHGRLLRPPRWGSLSSPPSPPAARLSLQRVAPASYRVLTLDLRKPALILKEPMTYADIWS